MEGSSKNAATVALPLGTGGRSLLEGMKHTPIKRYKKLGGTHAFSVPAWAPDWCPQLAPAAIFSSQRGARGRGAGFKPYHR